MSCASRGGCRQSEDTGTGDHGGLPLDAVFTDQGIDDTYIECYACGQIAVGGYFAEIPGSRPALDEQSSHATRHLAPSQEGAMVAFLHV